MLRQCQILLSKVKDKIEEVAQDKEITLSELLDVIKTAVDDSGLGDIKVIDKIVSVTDFN
jgi:hypothetical protein